MHIPGRGGGRGSKASLWSAFSLPSPRPYLLELLDLGLIEHGEDIGASALCHCLSPGLLGCLRDEGWAEGFMDQSLLLSRGAGIDSDFFESILLKQLFWL